MPSIEFKGKSFVQNHHLAVPYHELIPQPKKGLSKLPSLDDNLIVHGDNLLALKALLPTYAGKIKCIYIDPPYNTGNEGWVYNDNVNGPVMREWIGKVVGGEDEDLCRHDKWLCMMLPRLKLLRELLSDEGVIVISIDDNEAHRLRILLDEVFGESGFVASVVWQKRYSRENRGAIGDAHEYLLVYSRNPSAFQEHRGLITPTDKQLAVYKNSNNDPRGRWRAVPMTAQGTRPNQMYEISSPSGVKFRPSEGRCWSMTEPEFERLKAAGRIYFGKNGDAQPGVIRYLDEVEGMVPWTWWPSDEVGHTDAARKEIRGIFGTQTAFDTTKPVRLIQRVLEIAVPNGGIVLDSFAGSGTTAQAVLQLNKQDGGNRRFILIEMEDYADKITAERVRRVIKGVPKAKDEAVRDGLGGTFSYFELGDPIEAESLLSGENMPSYKGLARYLFYTATGERFDESKLSETTQFVGRSSEYDVYMLYKPDVEYLKSTALTWDKAKELSKAAKGRRVLVFAPAKYIEQSDLNELKITFCQLPFEIYKVTPGGAA